MPGRFFVDGRRAAERARRRDYPTQLIIGLFDFPARARLGQPEPSPSPS
jgi:hypothetical protein